MHTAELADVAACDYINKLVKYKKLAIALVREINR